MFRTPAAAIVALAATASGAAGQGLTVDAMAAAAFARVAGPLRGGAVLDAGSAGGWMAQSVGTPTVLFDGKLYRMWFTGIAARGPDESPYLFRSAIGAAVSADGLNWTILNDSQPVLTPGLPGSFDEHSVGHPFVMRNRSGYLMWYGGADGTQAPSGVRVERIGLAASTDGVHWTRLNGGAPVLNLGGPQSADSIQATGPCVIRTSSGYRMWYGAYNGKHTLAAADSVDGVAWIKDSVSGLGQGEALGPSVFRSRGEFFMMYSTIIENRWTLVGARSVDGKSWKPLANGAPVLPPSEAGLFDNGAPGQNRSVHPSQVLIEGNRIRVWYMGEDPADPFTQRIGLLETTIESANAADFSGDARTDLLWQDHEQGWLALWTMDGSTLASSDLLSPSRLSDTNWKIVGVGDVDGDNHPDIFWHEQNQGALAVWTMKGRQLTGSYGLEPYYVADTNWRVVAVVDLNDDGKPDLLWRDRVHGYIGAWFMDGLSMTASVAVNPERVADPAWEVVGTGDLNWDAKPDIIWQHRTSGALAAWLMEGSDLLDSIPLSPGAVADTHWRVVATGDFSGDGKTDLVWREDTKGWLVAWTMNGVVATRSADLMPNRVPQLNWSIAGPR